MSVTLIKARSIIAAIVDYREKNPVADFVAISAYAETMVQGISRHDVAETIEFLQELETQQKEITIGDSQPDDDKVLTNRVSELMAGEINLEAEVRYNYAVARALLEKILKRENSADSDEIRKTLREISRFSDTMLRQQERIYNVQEIQNFQRRVIEIFEELPPDTRDQIVNKILEAEL